MTAGDRVVIVGNTFAERLQHFPHLEAALVRRFQSEPPTFRNLGWSGDEVALQPRPLGFGALQDHLAEQAPHVILASFGMNESFAGEAGLPSFRRDLRTLLGGLREARAPGGTRARVVLISPIPQERLSQHAEQRPEVAPEGGETRLARKRLVHPEAGENDLRSLLREVVLQRSKTERARLQGHLVAAPPQVAKGGWLGREASHERRLQVGEVLQPFREGVADDDDTVSRGHQRSPPVELREQRRG